MQNISEIHIPTNTRTNIHHPYPTMKTLSMSATCLTLLLAFTGCDRPDPRESKHTFGTHTVTIADQGSKPYGGTSSTIVNSATETRIESFVSANGKYKLVFENEVLSVNGVKYTLEKPESEIRIIGVQVEINGAEAIPDEE